MFKPSDLATFSESDWSQLNAYLATEVYMSYPRTEMQKDWRQIDKVDLTSETRGEGRLEQIEESELV